MARATWSGFLSFGLVSVPVGLYTATADQTIHFNQLHKGTSHRVRYRKLDEDTGEELSTEDIVNGYPLGGGEYVVVTREEMAAAAPGKSELIEIQDFVDLKEIDPIFFRQSYYLAPKGKGADRAYALLLEAMRETNKVGIATLVLRDKEHLVAVRPTEQVLMLETMYFEDEIRDPKQELDTLPELGNAGPRELKIAKQLIDSLTDEWDPSRYKNTYRLRIEELIEKKREGNAVVFGDEERPKSNVVDLMSALQASIDRSSSKPRARKSAARASTATKSSSLKVSTHRERQGLDAMSKADLLGRATKLKLAVNSKMTKPELVKILGDAKKPLKKTARRVS
ncbi:MAG: Ku protein [Acidimicrobiales bacterium]